LDFLQIVDADQAAVAFLGEEDLGEVGDDGEFNQRLWGIDGMNRRRPERDVLREAAGNEIAFQYALGHGGHREVREGSSEVSAGVAVLEIPSKDHVECGAGHHSDLAQLRNFAC
jgi:hypothetical protein